jgi:hypothetical protein
VFKKHFEFCCGSCKGNTVQEKVSDWCRLWLDCSSWVERKWNDGWMESYILAKNCMFRRYHWNVIYHLVFYDADAEWEVRDNSAARIRKHLLQFLTPIYDDCEYSSTTRELLAMNRSTASAIVTTKKDPLCHFRSLR